MRIEFYNPETGAIAKETNDRLFVMNDKVYADNNYTTESQEATVMFETFIKEVPELDWRVVE